MHRQTRAPCWGARLPLQGLPLPLVPSRPI